MSSRHRALAPLGLSVLIGIFGCGVRPTPASAPPGAQASASAGGTTGGETNDDAPAPRRTTPQALVAPTSAELDAVRPLLARGPVFMVRNADAGADARITLVTRGRAPASAIHRAIITPGEYTTFMPILRDVELLSEHGNRKAFRFHVAAPLFDVTALCAMNVISERRVDVAITQSETGPGGSRWDLHPDGDETVVSLTTWGDPSQGHWLLRQVARRSPAAIAGMNISVDTVLGLGTVRRAEILSGRPLPMRPEQGIGPTGELAPPAPGAWQSLTRDATLVSTGLTPDGAVTQVTVATWTSADPEAVLTRLRDVTRYPSVWGSIRSVDVIANAPDAPAGSVRYHVHIETPLARIDGEQVMRTSGNTVWQDGVGGDLAGSSHRWDVLADPQGGSFVMLTGGADYNRAGWITRALMVRDPWLMAGFAGSWKIVWLRHLLRAV